MFSLSVGVFCGYLSSLPSPKICKQGVRLIGSYKVPEGRLWMANRTGCTLSLPDEAGYDPVPHLTG